MVVQHSATPLQEPFAPVQLLDMTGHDLARMGRLKMSANPAMVAIGVTHAVIDRRLGDFLSHASAGGRTASPAASSSPATYRPCQRRKIPCRQTAERRRSRPSYGPQPASGAAVIPRLAAQVRSRSRSKWL